MAKYLDSYGLIYLWNKIKSVFLSKNQAPVKIVDDVVYGKDYLTIYGSGAIDINNKRYYINSNTEDVGGDLTKYVDDKQSIIIDDSMYPLTVVIPEGSNVSYVDFGHVRKNKVTSFSVNSVNGIYGFITDVKIDFSDMNIDRMKLTQNTNLQVRIKSLYLDFSNAFKSSTINQFDNTISQMAHGDYAYMFANAHIVNFNSFDSSRYNYVLGYTNVEAMFRDCYIENNNVDTSKVLYGLGHGSLMRVGDTSKGVLPKKFYLYSNSPSYSEAFALQENSHTNTMSDTIDGVIFMMQRTPTNFYRTFFNQVKLQRVIFCNPVSANTDSMFLWCCTLHEIAGLKDLTFYTMTEMFAFQTITPEYVAQLAPSEVAGYDIANCMHTLDLSENHSKVYNFYRAFGGASQLRVIDMRGIGINHNIDYEFEGGWDNYVYHDMFNYYGNSVGHGYPFELTTFRLGADFFSAPVSDFVDWSMLHKWTDSSVVESLATNLYDRAGNGITKPITIKLSDETYTALGNDNIAAAVAKGYTITK